MWKLCECEWVYNECEIMRKSLHHPIMWCLIYFIIKIFIKYIFAEKEEQQYDSVVDHLQLWYKVNHNVFEFEHVYSRLYYQLDGSFFFFHYVYSKSALELVSWPDRFSILSSQNLIMDSLCCFLLLLSIVYQFSF